LIDWRRSPTVRLLAIVAVAALVLWAVVALHSVMTPFAVAFALAYVLNPLVNRLEAGLGRLLRSRRTGRPRLSPRPVAVGILFAVVVAAAALIGLVGIPAAFHQASDALRKLPSDAESLRTTLAPTLDRLSARYPEQALVIREQVETFLKEHLVAMVGRVTAFVQSAIFRVFSMAAGAIGVLIVPIFAAFLLYDMNNISDGIKDLVPRRLRPYAYSRMQLVDARVAAFVRGQLTVCLIMAVYYSIVLSLGGVPMGLLIGLLVGSFHLIPFMPTVLGLPLVGLLSLVDSQSLRHAALVVGVVVAGQFVEANIITPKIVGHGVGLHPVIVLMSVLVFGELFGVLGMLVGVPLTAALSVFWIDLRDLYLKSDFYRRGPTEAKGAVTPPKAP
jgi:predicted PurR-regulated permease PerM